MPRCTLSTSAACSSWFAEATVAIWKLASDPSTGRSSRDAAVGVAEGQARLPEEQIRRGDVVQGELHSTAPRPTRRNSASVHGCAAMIAGPMSTYASSCPVRMRVTP